MFNEGREGRIGNWEEAAVLKEVLRRGELSLPTTSSWRADCVHLRTPAVGTKAAASPAHRS